MPSPVQEAEDPLRAEALARRGRAEATALRPLHNPRVILDRIAHNRNRIVPNSEPHTSSLPQEDFCEDWLEA